MPSGLDPGCDWTGWGRGLDPLSRDFRSTGVDRPGDLMDQPGMCGQRGPPASPRWNHLYNIRYHNNLRRANVFTG